MDNLFEALHDVALILMPTLGAICLIILIVILVNIHKVVKQLTNTISNVDDVLISAKKSVDQLEQPLNTIANVASTVDKVNNSAVGIASKAVQFGLKNSDIISSFFSRGDDGKDVAGQNENGTSTDEPIVKEEDFGIYG